MKVYIQGIGNISPQKTYNTNNFLEEVVEVKNPVLRCFEPDYEKYIDPRQLRRMSRIIKNSWSAAKICLDEADIQIPDAIITGSGLGCVEDTEKFLFSIYENDEKLLPPTPFIQSTHNTIGSQIALMLQCTKNNITHTQRGGSFECALIDALLLLNENEISNVLVGSFDEMTDKQLVLYNRLKYYKSEINNNLGLLDHKTPGTIAGEGSSFFLISQEKSENCYAGIKDVYTYSNPTERDEIFDLIKTFLNNNQLTFQDIDLLITGMNGDVELDKIYYDIIDSFFHETPVTYFKHLCGDYHTANAFGMWLGSNILKREIVPEIVKLNDFTDTSFKNVLIYNHYHNINHSLILLSKC